MEDIENDDRESSGVSSDAMPEMLGENKKQTIIDAVNDFLQNPRFSNDICIVLTMPENLIKRHKEKLNAAIWNAFNKYKHEPNFTMLDVLIAVESMIDATKLSAMLDNDIKLFLAKERSISITVDELNTVVTSKRKTGIAVPTKASESTDTLDDMDDDDESDAAQDDFDDENTEDDDAEIMEGLI